MLDWFYPATALAQEATKTAAQPSMLEMLVMPVGFLFIMYFLIIRPQARKAKEHQSLVANLKAGDEVVTSGGIIGRVKSVAEQFVTVEIASNTNVKFTKTSILSLTKAQEAK